MRLPSTRLRTAAVGAMPAAALAACGGSDNGGAPKASASASGETPATPQGFTGIPDLVDKLAPSVVAIAVRTTNGAGEGSGVVWDRDGNIVTNNHVIEGASTVAVQTSAGDRLDARVVAADPRTDLAVIRVDGGDLPAATFAETLPRVGALALAMGSPLGFENTVTAGIVSGLDRALPAGGSEPSLVNLIQSAAEQGTGDEVTLVVRRGDRDRELRVKLGELPAPARGSLPGGDG